MLISSSIVGEYKLLELNMLLLYLEQIITTAAIVICLFIVKIASYSILYLTQNSGAKTSLSLKNKS